eukprot:GFUD01023590.1.p1 GENE.GFUD01023590.1~~GFUD01023590.1.p1  ORF type:complete len:154 (-),score=40.58 GFUD01023590.1:79-495(-)
MDAYKGKFERISSEGYEEFLKALDVSYILRKAAMVSTPVMEFSETNGVWSIKSSTTLKSMELKFKVGEEFEETTADGRDVRAIAKVEGGKFVIVQKAKKAGQASTHTVRELNGPNELIYTLRIEGNNSLVCVQKFKRI